MQWLVEVGLSNALAAAVLALAAWLVGKLWRRPAVTHALWLLVLLKLLTPPIIELPLPWSITRTVAFDSEIPTAPKALPAVRSPHRQEPAHVPPQSSTQVAAVGTSAQNATSRDGAREPQVLATDPAFVGLIQQSATHAAAPAAQVSPRTVSNPEPALSSDPPTATPWPGWPQLAAILWFAGMLAWLALQAVLGLRLRAMLQTSTPASSQLNDTATELAHRMGLRRRPPVRIVAGIGSPMLCGLGKRATILMPAPLLRRLGPEAQATVLAHELAHYQRGDQWVRLIELIATALYWWHPAVWWARQQLEIAEEQCCDAHVLKTCAGQTRVYAEALLDIVDLINEPQRQLRPAMASGIGQRPALQKRLADLMQHRCVPKMTPLTRRAIIAAGAVCMCCHPTFFVTEPPHVQAASTTSRVPLLAASTGSARNDLNYPKAHEALLAPSKSTNSPLSSGHRTAVVELPSDLPPTPAAEAYQDQWATAISPNGRYHLTVSRGYRCELREVTASQVHSLGGHRITCVAFTPDSERFVTGDLQGAVRIWSAVSGELLQTLTQQDGPVHSVCLAPPGDRIVAAGHEGIVELVSLIDLTDRHILARLNTPIRCARFSPDGSQLAVVTDSWKTTEACSVAVYDIASGARRLQWNLKGPIGALNFPSRDSLVTVEWSGRVRAWSLPALNAVDLPPLAKELVSAASFSRDTRILEDLAHHTADGF